MRVFFTSWLAFLLLFLGLGMVLPSVAPGQAADKSVLEKGETYLLRYKLNPGETIRYEVTHMAKTKTRIRGAEDNSQVHTISQRHWKVGDDSNNEAFKFDHVVDAVEMTQQQSDGDEVRWDSQSGETPPAIYNVVASQIGSKVSTVVIDPTGKELDRQNYGGSESKLGMGSLALSLPKDPIAIGESWSVPRQVETRTDEGQVKVVKIRERYTLEKVETGVATLSIRSEPLTAMSDPIRSQVVQQLSNGTIRFDIDNGRMLSKQLDWDESIVGFQGPNSLMEYRARFTEKLVDGIQRTAKKP